MGLLDRGRRRLLERVGLPGPRAARRGAEVSRTTGVAESELVAHDPGDVVTVGEIEIELVHTPGHTPGQPVLPRRRPARLRRHAVPRGLRAHRPARQRSRAAMYDSLQRLATLPDDTIVFPGHRYSMPSSATMEAIREQNYVFRPVRQGAVDDDVRPRLDPAPLRPSPTRRATCLGSTDLARSSCRAPRPGPRRRRARPTPSPLPTHQATLASTHRSPGVRQRPGPPAQHGDRPPPPPPTPAPRTPRRPRARQRVGSELGSEHRDGGIDRVASSRALACREA